MLQRRNEAFLYFGVDHTAGESDWVLRCRAVHIQEQARRLESGNYIPIADINADADGYRRIWSVSTSTTRFIEITGSWPTVSDPEAGIFHE